MVWLHEGGFGFRLRADKDDDSGKWVLSLSSDILPEKYDKELLETGTKKKARSFAVDWRKSHTETDSLLDESGISIGSSRNVFNPFNMSLAMMNLFLSWLCFRPGSLSTRSSAKSSSVLLWVLEDLFSL